MSNDLSPAEAERLALLIEECAEAQQIACKVLRHGYAGFHPEGEELNRDTLEKELGHIAVAMELMFNAGDIQNDNVSQHAYHKQVTVNRWLHHNATNPVMSTEVKE